MQQACDENKLTLGVKSYKQKHVPVAISQYWHKKEIFLIHYLVWTIDIFQTCHPEWGDIS